MPTGSQYTLGISLSQAESKFEHALPWFCCFCLYSFSALQESLNENFMLIITHREAQRDYSLNFPGTRTVQEVSYSGVRRQRQLIITNMGFAKEVLNFCQLLHELWFSFLLLLKLGYGLLSGHVILLVKLIKWLQWYVFESQLDRSFTNGNNININVLNLHKTDIPEVNWLG